jgi:hypothetical protein
MITGKVAAILGDEEVVLNVGREDGVEEDTEFVIFLEGRHIFDPETGEDLGAIETVKGRVEVYHVMDKMSRARTLTYQVPMSSLYEALARPGGALLGYQTRRRKLQVPEEQVSGAAEDFTVKVGDRVRSV